MLAVNAVVTVAEMADAKSVASACRSQLRLRMKTAFVEGEIFPVKTPFAARVTISVVVVVVAVKGEVLDAGCSC